MLCTRSSPKGGSFAPLLPPLNPPLFKVIQWQQLAWCASWSITQYTTTANLSEKRNRLHGSGFQHTCYHECHYLVDSWPSGWPLHHVFHHKISNLLYTMTVLLISNLLGFIYWDFSDLVLQTDRRYWFHSKFSKGAIWKDCKSQVWESGDVCY